MTEAKAVARFPDDSSDPSALQIRCTRSDIWSIKKAALKERKTVSQFLLDCYTFFQEQKKPLHEQKSISLTFSSRELQLLDVLTDLGYLAFAPEFLAEPVNETRTSLLHVSFYKLRQRITLALGARMNWTPEDIGRKRD